MRSFARKSWGHVCSLFIFPCPRPAGGRPRTLQFMDLTPGHQRLKDISKICIFESTCCVERRLPRDEWRATKPAPYSSTQQYSITQQLYILLPVQPPRRTQRRHTTQSSSCVLSKENGLNTIPAQIKGIERGQEPTAAEQDASCE